MMKEVFDDVVWLFVVVGCYDELFKIFEIYFGGFCDVFSIGMLVDEFGGLLVDFI